MKDTDVVRAAEFIGAELPREAWPHWNQGWPRESEAALLDAIFSSRAAYGTPKTGVRAVVDRWRTHRSVAADDRLDSLPALAAFTDRGDELATILGNRQRVPGNYFTKAEGAARAAKRSSNPVAGPVPTSRTPKAPFGSCLRSGARPQDLRDAGVPVREVDGNFDRSTCTVRHRSKQ